MGTDARADGRRRWRRWVGLPLLVAVGGVAVVARGALSTSHPAAPAGNGGTDVISAAVGAPFRVELALLESILEPPAAGASTAPAVPTAPAKPVRLIRPFSGRRPLRIMVVGSSVGVTFARGLKLWGDAHGAQVLDAARYWCPLGRWMPEIPGLGIAVPGEGCSGWATRWANDVRNFDPDVVLVYFSVWEISPRLLPGQHEFLQPGAPALDAWQLSEYQAAADVLSARGAPVVWFTIPCENQPILDHSPFWYVNRKTIPALAASRPQVHVIDLDHELCANGPTDSFGGVQEARPDGAHYSDAGALAVSNWVMPIVTGETANPRTTDETDPPPPIGLIRRAS